MSSNCRTQHSLFLMFRRAVVRGGCVLNYDITFIGPDAVEAGDIVECDGTAHLFIDDALGSEGFADNGLTQSGPYFD